MCTTKSRRLSELNWIKVANCENFLNLIRYVFYPLTKRGYITIFSVTLKAK